MKITSANTIKGVATTGSSLLISRGTKKATNYLFRNVFNRRPPKEFDRYYGSLSEALLWAAITTVTYGVVEYLYRKYLEERLENVIDDTLS